MQTDGEGMWWWNASASDVVGLILYLCCFILSSFPASSGCLTCRYLKQRANDAESPLVKAKLNDDGDRLQQKAQTLIGHVNAATRNPNDANQKKDLDSFVCRG
jgi:hypothetical protein